MFCSVTKPTCHVTPMGIWLVLLSWWTWKQSNIPANSRWWDIWYLADILWHKRLSMLLNTAWAKSSTESSKAHLSRAVQCLLLPQRSQPSRSWLLALDICFKAPGDQGQSLPSHSSLETGLSEIQPWVSRNTHTLFPSLVFHKITGWMAEVGRVLWRPSEPTSLLKQGCLEQTAQDCLPLAHHSSLPTTGNSTRKYKLNPTVAVLKYQCPGRIPPVITKQEIITGDVEPTWVTQLNLSPGNIRHGQ